MPSTRIIAAEWARGREMQLLEAGWNGTAAWSSMCATTAGALFRSSHPGGSCESR